MAEWGVTATETNGTEISYGKSSFYISKNPVRVEAGTGHEVHMAPWNIFNADHGDSYLSPEESKKMRENILLYMQKHAKTDINKDGGSPDTGGKGADSTDVDVG